MLAKICSLIIASVMLLSCTAQKPVGLKNTTRSTKEINPICSNLNLDEDLLTKQNIINLFSCTGWDKSYPDLMQKLSIISDQDFNEVSRVFGQAFLSSKDKRKNTLNLIIKNEKSGNLKSLSRLLELLINEANVLDSLSVLFQNLNSNEIHNLFQIISKNQKKNLNVLQAFQDISLQYDLYGQEIRNNISPNELLKLKMRATVLVDDLTDELSTKDWKYVSGLFFYKGESPLHSWMDEGKSKNLSVLLDTIGSDTFIKDVSYLDRSLINGITCSNKSSYQNFNIDVGHELGYKIDALVLAPKEVFEDKLIHGFTKFVAFREFCEEEKKKQGLEAFLNVIKYALQVTESDHDYKFLSTLHRIFDQDKFKLLSFIGSKSFSELRDLLLIQEDDKFIRSIYWMLSSANQDAFKIISELISELESEDSKASLWINSFSKTWHQLSTQEKVQIVGLLTPLLNGEINVANVFSILIDVLETNNLLSQELAHSFANSNFQKSVQVLIRELNHADVKADLAKLLSENGLFQLFSILSGNTEPVKKESDRVAQDNKIPHVLSSRSRSQRAERICHAELYENYLKNPGYYSVVNGLPESCFPVISNVGFVGQIYLWMFESNRFFVNKYGVTDFHSGTGVWAPGMLQLIFTAAVGVDQYLENENGTSGILHNINTIHKELTSESVLELVHQSATLYLSVEKNLSLESRLKDLLNKSSDFELKELINNLFKAFSPNQKKIEVKSKKISCANHNPDLGVNPCLSKEEIKLSAEKMIRTLKRKNRSGDSLIKLLLAWIHPEGGINLPHKKHSTSLKEILGFLRDLSDKKTLKKINYYSGNKVLSVEANALERLEVVIRDISFLDNFYGAYFKNEVASSANYRDHVIKSERLMVALERGGGLFRGVGSFPDETKDLLKNVRESYSSLVELADNYVQQDGAVISYDNFIQSLLAAIQKSSPVRTQNFNAYRNPNPKVVKGHNGVFLTEVVKLSGLRHMSNYVRSRIDSNLLETPEFVRINNFVGKLDLKILQDKTQLILDKYLDNDQNQLNTLIFDMIDFIDALTPKEQKVFEEIILKILLLISSDEFELDSLNNFPSIIDSLVKNWPSLRKVLIDQASNKLDLLEFINTTLDRVVSNPAATSGFISFVSKKDLFKSTDLDMILADASNLATLGNILRSFSMVTQINFKLNWYHVLNRVMNSPNLKLDSFREFMTEALSEQSNKLSLSLLVSEIALKEENGYRMKYLLDELFINHQGKLESFLQETFPALRMK